MNISKCERNHLDRRSLSSWITSLSPLRAPDLIWDLIVTDIWTVVIL
jgi:hypothetical protein